MDNVLVAEDDFSIRSLIKSYLRKYKDKFELIIVEDGLEAIKILRRKPISLLITDLKMPKVEGLVLLSYMNTNFPKIPCIVMTSLRKPRLKERLKKDVLNYIEKPFKPDEFANAIMSALKQDITMDTPLQGISIISFLELIQMEKKTCLCQIESPYDISGSLYFDNGALFSAFYGSLEGEEAALEMFQLESVTIEFKEPPQNEIERRIFTDLADLIMKAMRPVDESNTEN
ncbi:MAG: response regulator [Desulfobacteraceae bacterium]|nr:response regulator [Desulfobacteraceae bacterium]